MINSFRLSVSARKFADKNKIWWGNVKYHQEALSIGEFVELIKQGYCFCHCFNTETEVFGVSEKRESNFMSAQMVFVDVDDSQFSLAEFVGRLSKKPTLAYTTPNNHTEKSNWLYRFRLCYLLKEPITSVEVYGKVYDCLMQSISNDIPTFEMKDNCGRSACQQFGGNALSDCELIENGIVYSLSDFPFQNNNVSLFFSTNILFSNGKTHHEKTDIEITDEEFMADMDSMTPVELLEKYRNKYPYFDHTELNYENGYALIPLDYQEIYRSWYFTNIEKRNGTKRKIAVMKRHRDGEGRRKKLFVAGLIMKKIMPKITYEHLLCNLFYEVYHHYDNTDNVFNNTTLKSIAKGIMNIPTEEIRLKSRCKNKFKVDKAFCAEHCIKPNGFKNKVRKILKDEEIGSVYDCSLPLKENKRLMNEIGIKVGLTKLYEWCKENGISPKGTKTQKTPCIKPMLLLYYTLRTREEKTDLRNRVESIRQAMKKAVV